jgi:hypothetical protein
MADRPKSPYLPDGTLDPREWKIACTAANVIGLVLLPGEPWFVEVRPVHVPGKGVELEVVVRWLSPDVLDRVPAAVDGYAVEIVIEGASERAQTVQ